MARLVLTNAYITINSVNLSDHIASVTLTTNDDVVETTAFGSTARTRDQAKRFNHSSRQPIIQLHSLGFRVDSFEWRRRRVSNCKRDLANQR
jgi:hypothetical protein